MQNLQKTLLFYEIPEVQVALFLLPGLFRSVLSLIRILSLCQIFGLRR